MTDTQQTLRNNGSTDMPTFPRHARLRNPKQFQDTFSQGHRINAALFRLHLRFSPLARDESGRVDPVSCKNNPGSAAVRLGIAVSKRVDPHAVGRNRIKRAARESFRLIRARLPAGDYVLLAQRQAASADNAQLAQALDGLWARAAALEIDTRSSASASAEVPLKRGAAAVTMPPRDLAVTTPGRTAELP